MSLSLSTWKSNRRNCQFPSISHITRLMPVQNFNLKHVLIFILFSNCLRSTYRSLAWLMQFVRNPHWGTTISSIQLIFPATHDCWDEKHSAYPLDGICNRSFQRQDNFTVSILLPPSQSSLCV